MAHTIRGLLIAMIAFGGASMVSADHLPCSQDLNNDGVVDAKDRAIVENAMGAREGVGKYDERADLNQDGFVTISDREMYLHCAS